MKYSEIVKSLRVCAASIQDYDCEVCSYREAGDCTVNLKHDAADAIEELQAEVEVLKAEKTKLAENSLRFIGKARELDKKRLESKHGEWIEIIEDVCECSVCGSKWLGVGGYIYCPNCGAKMGVNNG